LYAFEIGVAPNIVLPPNEPTLHHAASSTAHDQKLDPKIISKPLARRQGVRPFDGKRGVRIAEISVHEHAWSLVADGIEVLDRRDGRGATVLASRTTVRDGAVGQQRD